MDNGKTILKCSNPDCGKQFRFPTPVKSGSYGVPCPHCKTKNHFTITKDVSSNPLSPDSNTEDSNQIHAQSKKEQSQSPRPAQQLGFLENGSYRFICENDRCKQSILVPAERIKRGHNMFICPKCQTKHEFEKEPTQEELLCCQKDGCKGKLKDPNRGDGLYTVECLECHTMYKIVVIDNKIVKVQNVTSSPLSLKKQFPMKLSVHSFFGNKDYPLTKGTHYVGRMDQNSPSDFMIKDKYSSARSLKIEVNQIGDNVVYKLTVTKATNPVYHNNKELKEGDIIYLNYGDTIKIGTTLIKVKKICK